nr:GNAT family N-acetyltransferase [Marinicella rhabdoformis]
MVLLNEHLKEMLKYSPSESIHALDPETLNDRSITFWSARVNGEIAGCIALKEIDDNFGEIKSMKTSRLFLRKGVAESLLQLVLKEAKMRAYSTIGLETGSNEAFAPAVALYKKHGFEECGPFGNYELDVFSKFFRKGLQLNT